MSCEPIAREESLPENANPFSFQLCHPRGLDSQRVLTCCTSNCLVPSITIFLLLKRGQGPRCFCNCQIPPSICSASIKVMVVGLLWRRGPFDGKLQLTSARCWAAARGANAKSGSQACHSAQLPVRALGFPDLQAAIWTNIWGAGCFWNPFWIWQPEQRTQFGMEQRGVNAAQSHGRGGGGGAAYVVSHC